MSRVGNPVVSGRGCNRERICEGLRKGQESLLTPWYVPVAVLAERICRFTSERICNSVTVLASNTSLFTLFVLVGLFGSEDQERCPRPLGWMPPCSSTPTMDICQVNGAMVQTWGS